MLYRSLNKLFKASHLGRGADLGCLLIDVYESKEETVSDESRGATSFGSSSRIEH